MEGALPFLIGGVVLFVALMAVLRWVLRSKRRDALSEFALTFGGQFFEALPSNFARNFRTFYPFSREGSLIEALSPDLSDALSSFSDRERIENVVIASKNGADWYAFDYIYVTGSGKDRTTHYCGVVATRVPMNLPQLNISGEDLFSKIGAAIGFRDLQFEYEEFNKRYKVTAQDERTAYQIICPEMMEYLMKIPVRNWQILGNFIVITRYGLMDPMEITRVAADIDGFLHKFPKFVVQDRTVQPTWRDPLDGLIGLPGSY